MILLLVILGAGALYLVCLLFLIRLGEQADGSTLAGRIQARAGREAEQKLYSLLTNNKKKD